MSLFAIALTIHVLTAMLGLGPVVAMAIASARRPTDASLAQEIHEFLRRLSTWTAVALGVMLVSGVLIELGAGGSFHQTWWFRTSFVFLLAMGAVNGQVRRRLRRVDPARAAEALPAVGVLTWTMLGLIALVTVLMINRPW
jgi:hypothetical protein